MTQENVPNTFDPSHPFYELSLLSNEKRERLSEISGTTEDTLMLLAEYGSDDIKLNLMQHINSEAPILETVYHSKLIDKYQINLILASHENTPIYILKEIAQHANSGALALIESILMNPNVYEEEGQEIVTSFVYHKSWHIRAAAAKILDFSMSQNHVFIQPLVNDPYYRVHGELLENKTLPTSILETLFNVDDTKTHQYFMRNISTPTRIIEQIWETDIHDEINDYQYILCANPNTPSQLLHRFVEQYNHIGKDERQRKISQWLQRLHILARHPNASRETLELIMKKIVPNELTIDIALTTVYKEVLLNKNFGVKNFDKESQRLLELGQKKELSFSTYMQYLKIILLSPLCSQEWLENSATDQNLGKIVAQNPITPPQILETIASSGHPQALEELALNPNTPLHVLESLIYTKNSRIPFMLVENPSLGEDFYAKMLKSGDPLVQSGVLRGLVFKNNDFLIQHMHYLTKDSAVEYVFPSNDYSRNFKIQLAKQFNLDFPNNVLLEHIYSEPTKEVKQITGEVFPEDVALEMLKALVNSQK